MADLSDAFFLMLEADWTFDSDLAATHIYGDLAPRLAAAIGVAEAQDGSGALSCRTIE